MTTPLAFLRATHAAVQAEAEAASVETGAPGWHGDDSGLYSDDASRHPAPFLADAYGYTAPEIVTHIVGHDPVAALRRIAADRKLIAVCEKVLAVDGWEYDDAPKLAEHVISNLAAGWGWTEEET